MSQSAPGGAPKVPTPVPGAPTPGTPAPGVPPKPGTALAAVPPVGAAPSAADAAETQRRLLRGVLDIEVPLVAALCERNMTLEDVRNLTTGSVIEFSRSYDEPLDLLIGDVRIGSGEPVTVHEKFGLRVQSIGSVRERIRKLGGA